MDRQTASPSIAGRLVDALLRALDPGQEVCVDAELLKHFPFACVGEAEREARPMRMPTTVHGAL